MVYMGGIAMGKRWKRVWCLTLFVCLLVSLKPGTALAATKSISSVTVRVGTDTGVGNRLPENIDLVDNSTDSRDGTYAATNSEKFYVREAEWVTSTSQYMNIGQEPKMRLYLYVNDTNYGFQGTYSSSNVSVKGGTFVSARRRSSKELEIVVKVNGIKGEYPAPAEATWSYSALGRARWNADIDDDDYTRTITSGYYDVYLYRGSTVIKKLESYKGTSYNFYPYMTKAGTYTYKVRTVPYTEEEKKYGKRSAWLESDELYIDSENVSDGSGQTDSTGAGSSTNRVGWILDGSTWYYRYPDGSYQRNSWLKVDGKWYLFDASGRMLTGWQNKDGLTYYLLDSGAMYSGWIKAGGQWYYLNRPEDGGVEGAMRIGWLVTGGQTYYLKADGIMAEGWYQADGNWYYFYPGSGHKAVNTVIDTFYVDGNGVWNR